MFFLSVLLYGYVKLKHLHAVSFYIVRVQQTRRNVDVWLSTASIPRLKYEFVHGSQLTQHSGKVFMICILWQGSFLMLDKNPF